jgi:hypothetical protein
MATAKQVKFVTPIGRASFPTLVEPRNFKGEGPLKFSIGLYLKIDDFLASGLGDLIENMAHDNGFNAPVKRGGKEIPAIWNNPIRYKDEIKKLPNQLADMDVCLFTAKTGAEYPPRVVGPDNKPMDPELIVAGDFVRCSLTVKPWKTQMGQGISLYLGGVQLVRHATESERFVSSDADFERLESAPMSDEFVW